MNRIVGLVLIAAGAVVLWYGWEAYQSLGSSITRMVEGMPSTKSLILFGVGGVLVLVGLGFAGGRIGGSGRRR